MNISKSGEDSFKRGQLNQMISLLSPLYQPPPPPTDDDWRAKTPRYDDYHTGQTLDQFAALWQPNQLVGTRNTIHLNATDEVFSQYPNVLEAGLCFVRDFYQIRVNTGRPISLTELPQDKRLNGCVETNAILGMLREGNLEKGDSLAHVAITSVDLYSGEPTEWVFGETSMSASEVAEVSVASFCRFGVGDRHTPEQVALKRFIKVLLHEVGHVYKIWHEVHTHCLMCGMNHLEELDRTPFELCPTNLAKVMWASGLDPRKRATDLIKLCRRFGFSEEAAWYQHELSILKNWSRRGDAG